jgi:hypothetical protein
MCSVSVVKTQGELQWPTCARTRAKLVLVNGIFAAIFLIYRACQYFFADWPKPDDAKLPWMWLVCFSVASFLCLWGTLPRRHAVLGSTLFGIIITTVFWFAIVNYSEPAVGWLDHQIWLMLGGGYTRV